MELENRFGDALNPRSGKAATATGVSVVAVHADSDFESHPVRTAGEHQVTDEVPAGHAESSQVSVDPGDEASMVHLAAELTASTGEIVAGTNPVVIAPDEHPPEPMTVSGSQTSAKSATNTIVPWSREDFTPQATLATDGRHVDTSENGQAADADDEADFLSALEEFEVSLDRLAPLLGHDAIEADDKQRARTDRFDEASEIRFMKAFQRIPDGQAGERLLAALSQGATGPKFHKLVELYRAGLDVDEIAVAWSVRENWNAANSDKYGLTYRSIGAIMRTYTGTPDPDEVLQLLGALRDDYHRTQQKGTRFFYSYVDELAECLEASERAGHYVPIDMLTAARNYR